MKKNIFILLIFLFVTLIFFYPFFLRGKLPIPSDTIIGLYHPFRDLYAKEYPNGIPYKNFLITDPVRQQYPWRILSLDLEKKAQLPLWNPYNFAGTPLLATLQSAAFYPLNLLLLLFPFWFGWSMMIVLQPLLAGLFLYFYLRHLRLSTIASFFGGTVFAFCGFSTAWLEWNTIVNTALWFPLVLLSIDKIFDTFARKDYRWPVVFALSLTFSFFAGHLQTFFYLFLVSFLYFIARWFQFGRSKKVLLFFLFFICCFLLVTVIQWLPTLQFILQSGRNVDQLNNWQQDGWFIPWQNLVQFIAPDFFGNPATLNYWGIWNYGEFIGYIGLFPLLIALFALFYRHDKKTFFFGILFFLSLIFSLPTIFAKLPYLLQLPFISTSQPTRLLFVTDFSLAILSALGLDLFIRNNIKQKILYPALFMVIVFFGLWGFVIFGYKSLHISGADIAVAKHNLYFPTVLFVFILFVSVVTTFIKNAKVRMSLLILLLVVSVFDLFRFSSKFIPFTNRQYLFPSTAALTYLQKQQGQFRIMTTDSQILPPNFSIMYHLQSLDGYDPLYIQRYGELMAAMGRDKPDIHSPFGFNRIITPTNIKSRLIDLLGVKYVLSLSDIHEQKLVKVFSEGQTQIYKNTQAFPRVFFVTTVKPAEDKNEAINLLFDQKINLHNTAIVENFDNDTMTFATGSAMITDYQENSVTITTKSQGETFLVLTDTYYPTWHIKIDGKEEKIYRTDYDLRGVFIQKGNHHVVFYDSLL